MAYKRSLVYEGKAKSRRRGKKKLISRHIKDVMAEGIGRFRQPESVQRPMI